MKHIKNSLLVGWVICSALLFLQCKDETGNTDTAFERRRAEGVTVITGKIHNRDVFPHVKYMNLAVPHVSGGKRVVQLESFINKDGTFYFELDLAQPQEVVLTTFVDFLYLIPGDSIHVEFDFKDLSFKVKLSGGHSVAINRDFYNYFDKVVCYDYHISTKDRNELTWAEVRKKLDKHRQYNLEKRLLFLQKYKVCDEVVFLSKAMIELNYYIGLAGNALTWKDLYGKEVMDMQVLMNELHDVAVKYFSSGLYSNAHFRFISIYKYTAQTVKPQGSDKSFAEWAKEVAKTDTIRNFMLATKAGAALLSKNLAEFEELYAHVDHQYLSDRLMNDYSKVRTNMINPEKISSSILDNPNDFFNNISLDKNIIAKTIAPYKEQVHVINIWTEWCPPCHDVLMQFKPLVDEFAGKDVCFSFLCVGGDQEKALKFFRQTGLDEASNHFGTAEDAQFLFKAFSPFVIPYGIIVNRKGVMVDYGSHLQPGVLLREKINLLLEQDKLLNY